MSSRLFANSIIEIIKEIIISLIFLLVIGKTRLRESM